jgi:hypothetical protein
LVDSLYLTNVNEIINFWNLMADNFVWSNGNSQEGLFFVSYFQKKDEVVYGHMADFFFALCLLVNLVRRLVFLKIIGMLI